MPPERRKIWELGEMQCPVIGTCLSLPELRKIGRKLGLDIPERATDFEVHGRFVSMSRQEGPVARLVSKTLDRKFARTVRRWAQARSEAALTALWDEVLAQGGGIRPDRDSVNRSRGPAG